jgi:hypothetical protein
MWRARISFRSSSYSDEAIAATIAYCKYIHDRYGRFPINGGPFRTLLAYQAHRLDSDFYDSSTRTTCYPKGPPMATNDYQFITHWRVKGLAPEVYDVVVDARGFLRWWPQVYLEVTTVKPAGEHGLGGAFDLRTRGKVPYTLRWQARVSETHYPEGFTIEATGDFGGRGVWSFTQDGDWVNITFDWRLRAEKPLLRYLSFLFKPLFSANHRWAMVKGEEGLRRELSRNR